ncbi:hypothetical protein [Pantoea ananatis]|uniref:hypothetical protein n=1 Tax=Pantoea ananas TaxID=553 RepID=UPI001EE5D89F|nr:hypothetical protein [Pantoea ananatis]PKC45621.1 hypothetical protein V461_05915 [Pantoea ananatis BRT98]
MITNYPMPIFHNRTTKEVSLVFKTPIVGNTDKERTDFIQKIGVKIKAGSSHTPVEGFGGDLQKCGAVTSDDQPLYIVCVDEKKGVFHINPYPEVTIKNPNQNAVLKYLVSPAKPEDKDVIWKNGAALAPGAEVKITVNPAHYVGLASAGSLSNYHHPAPGQVISLLLPGDADK